MRVAWQAQHKRQVDVLGDQGGDVLRRLHFGAADRQFLEDDCA